MYRAYKEDDLYVPREDNRFWKAFRIGMYCGYGKLPKYEVTCYSHKGVERVVVMDQELMEPMMREITQHELKEMYNVKRKIQSDC